MRQRQQRRPGASEMHVRTGSGGKAFPIIVVSYRE